MTIGWDETSLGTTGELKHYVQSNLATTGRAVPPPSSPPPPRAPRSPRAPHTEKRRRGRAWVVALQSWTMFMWEWRRFTLDLLSINTIDCGEERERRVWHGQLKRGDYVQPYYCPLGYGPIVIVKTLGDFGLFWQW